jgi:hypothetical protein
MIFVADVIPIFPKDFESTFVSGMISVASDAIKTEHQFCVIECLQLLVSNTNLNSLL